MIGIELKGFLTEQKHLKRWERDWFRSWYRIRFGRLVIEARRINPKIEKQDDNTVKVTITPRRNIFEGDGIEIEKTEVTIIDHLPLISDAIAEANLYQSKGG